ncbi:MAG: sulfite exporter TauE/SafE family protein [Bryobacteraceae bacterium]
MPSQLESYLAANSNDPVFLATAMGTAVFLGAAHALTPGHGKTIVAAYLAGSRGRVADAVYLGAIVTITHTASVFVLGLLTLYASTRVSLDRIFPWLSLLSGALVLVIGGWLLWQRTRSWSGSGDRHAGHHHGHSHGHGHSHSHSHGDAVSRSSILSLGISGGLVPCPEALVVLMLSISLHRIALGLGLLVAFSIGLAAVLIAIGVAMVFAGPALRKATGDSAITRNLPIVSAAVVTLLGLAMVFQSLQQF